LSHIQKTIASPKFLFSLFQSIFILTITFFATLTAADTNQPQQITIKEQAAADAMKPPLSSFSRIPAFSRVRLSPNGLQVAYIQNYPSPHNLAVLTVYNPKTTKSKLVLKSDNKAIKINWFRWANEEILIVSARFEASNRHVKYFETRLMSIDVTVPTSEIELVRLLKPKGRLNYSTDKGGSQFQDSVIDFLPNDSEHILVEADFDKPQQPSVYKVNVRTGKQKWLEKGKRSIRSWMTDQQSRIRIGRARDYRTGKITYYERTNKESDFRVLFEYMSLQDEPISVRGFGIDPNIVYYTQYKDDKNALYKMNLTTMESELVLAHQDYDVSGGLIYSKITQDAIGVYDEHSKFGRFYFDDANYKFHSRLDRTFPDTTNSIISRSNDESIYIVYAEADNIPGMYFYGNRKENSIIPLTESYPELYGTTLAHHEKISYKARDGVEIEAYLTLPVFGEAPYPTVIHPHGGPGARDYEGFDPWVAYLTSRGYAVLRPNFRGSVGYGFEFSQAQMGRWGLEMQDDISDATTFLIDRGTANPKKTCIFGASYGGYAATMATVKTPDLFTCAVSFAGVTDLREMVRNTRRYLGGDLVAEKQFGDETDDLKDRSPLYNIEKIKTPILLMHGDEDRSVPVAQSQDFAEELEGSDKNVRYIELKDGGHNLAIQENRTIFFEELDAFLKEHLGVIEP
jgi:dipeptidyl aminopeptidase/acylaminoacyl peptidase